jgi:hypothetical protein
VTFVGSGKLCLLRAKFNLQFELEFHLTASVRANVGAPLASALLDTENYVKTRAAQDGDSFAIVSLRRIKE